MSLRPIKVLTVEAINKRLSYIEKYISYLQANGAGSSSTFTVAGKLNLESVSEYTDNAAAVSGGLSVGDVYRTGDILKIVH